MKIINYFIDSLYKVDNHETVPYYLEIKTKDYINILSVKDIEIILKFIIHSKHPVDCFKYLKKNKLLDRIFPYLNRLVKIPQKKHKTKNAFAHTMNVLELIGEENIDLRWVALFHDLGKYDSYVKYGNFKNHALYSYQLSLGLCKMYNIPHSEKICTIVKNHMFPLDYQRNPNWTKKAVNNFIDRVGGKYAVDTVSFSYYDKKSENDIREFLQSILDLKERVYKICHQKK